MAIITWNPNDKGTRIILSSDNLTVNHTGNSAVISLVRATSGKTTGKWYWEVKTNSTPTTGTTANRVGVTDLTQGLNAWGNNPPSNYYNNGGIIDVGTVIGVALNLDTREITYYINGVLMYTEAISTLSTVYPFYQPFGVDNATANFGATPFNYNIPHTYYSYDGSQYGNVSKTLFSSADGKVKSINYKKESHITMMTSNVLPSPLVASASTQLNATYNAFKAFQDYESNVGDSWRVSAGNSTGWIQIDFGIGKKANKIYVKSHLDGATGSLLTTCPKNFEILGSNDGVTFTLLGEIKNQIDWKSVESREFDFKNANSYRYYRVNVTENNGYVGYLNIGRIKFGYDEKNISSLPSKSEQRFISHGMSQSDLASVDMYADFTEKHYIQDVTTILGSGKVFEHVLDVNKVLKKIKMK